MCLLLHRAKRLPEVSACNLKKLSPAEALVWEMSNCSHILMIASSGTTAVVLFSLSTLKDRFIASITTDTELC